MYVEFSETNLRAMSSSAKTGNLNDIHAAITKKREEINALGDAGFTADNLSSIFARAGETHLPGAVDALVKFVDDEAAFSTAIKAFTPADELDPARARARAITSIASALHQSKQYCGLSVRALTNFTSSAGAVKTVHSVFEPESVSAMLHGVATSNNLAPTITEIRKFCGLQPDTRNRLIDVFTPTKERGKDKGRKLATKSLSYALSEARGNLPDKLTILTDNIDKLQAICEAREPKNVASKIQKTKPEDLQDTINTMYAEVTGPDTGTGGGTGKAILSASEGARRVHAASVVTPN